MDAILGLVVAGLLSTDGAGLAAPANPSPAKPALVSPDDVVEVTDSRGGARVRGRIAELTADMLSLDTGRGRVRLDMSSVHRIDRVGDSIANGTAVGAAVGGGLTLATLATVCANSNCADTIANLDPRITLLGTAIGAGIGAVVDAAIQARKPVYRAGSEQPTLLPAMPSPRQTDILLVGRLGWAKVTDDEGSLGNGPTFGTGVLMSFRERIGLQLAYDRHTRRRDFEQGGGFFGTEQLVTAKALFFFRPGRAVRPYAAVGLGLIDSNRRSEFPTYLPGPAFPVQGPLQILRYHSRERAVGFGTGFTGRVTRRVSVLGDLTFDVGGGQVLGSTRLTVGAGWHF